MITSFVGYWGATDATYPAVGELYLGRIFVSIPGNACADGITDALMYVNLPSNTYLYSDAQNSIHCYWKGSNSNTFADVTAEPNAQCQTNPTYYPGYGYYMAYPILATGAQFFVQFPIYSTVPHSGIADSSSRMVARIESSDTPASTLSHPNNSPQFPDQYVFVAANPPTVTYPVPSATLIASTTARTTANLNNHFVSGNLYFDLGTSTAYGDVTSPLPIPNTSNTQSPFVDWAGLIPGTLHHWRARFVTAGGTYTGVDQTFTTTGTAPPASRARGDFYADGKADILWRSSAGANLLWSMNGTSVVSGAYVPSVDPGWTLAASGDFNGDGKADLVWRETATGRYDIWIMNGASFVSDVVYSPFPAGWQIAATRDTNADGKDDILWRNTLTGANLVWLMNGANVTLGQYMPSVDPSWTLALTGDFNGDGKMDLVWQENSTRRLDIWLMNGPTFMSDAVYSGFPAPWQLVAAADANADGKDDIIWRNTGTGANLLWTMNGTSVMLGQYIPTVDPSWTLAAWGDFSGDRKVDLVWRETATGRIDVWQMNGAAFVTDAVYSGYATGAWSIVSPK